MGNAEHLAQLEGDAREVAEEACRRFAGFAIASSRRDVRSQAVAMAGNVARQRTWILGDATTKATYRWSKCAHLLHGWAVGHQKASEIEIAKAFTDIMNGLPTSELCKLSAHLAAAPDGAHAFDVKTEPLLTPKGRAQKASGSLEPEWSETGLAVLEYLGQEAKARGGTLLTREGKLLVIHWQAKRSE